MTEEEAATLTAEQRGISKRLVCQINVSPWILESLAVSTDGKRVAYLAQVDKKYFTVVDGQEGEQYNFVWKYTLIFSPDSKSVAY